MYKLSVPIMFRTINKENIDLIIENFRKCKVDRIFLVGISYLFDKNATFCSEDMKWKIEYLKKNGFEVGLWFSAFGHGVVLSHESGEELDISMYTKSEGIDGVNEYIVCPYDPKVIEIMGENLKKVASMNADLLMFDDDYRLDFHNHRMCCMCKNHLEEYYKRIGEVIPREELERKIFSGGKNFYRTEWLKLQGETLTDFALKMREKVNEVNSEIKMGFCACLDPWDFNGTNCIEISKALAGDTAPFMRLNGAPYHNPDVAMAVESSRTQANWCKNSSVEIFAEGDVYPRPRYNVPARMLELFDLAILSTGELDGILKYMYDYSQPFNYETGYYDRHIKNEKIRNELKCAVTDKKAVGLRVIDVMAKTENWHLSETTPDGVSDYLVRYMENARFAKRILTDNAIPTNYDNINSPCFIMGENAYYVGDEDLKHGAVLDISAARILTERGFDVGFLSAESSEFTGEYFIDENDTIFNLTGAELFKVKCDEKAEVETLLMPYKTPGSYRYENGKGQRFFVLAVSLLSEIYKSYNCVSTSANYTSNYYRKAQLCSAIEYVSGEAMAVKTYAKCPNLYMIALENAQKSAITVSLSNPFIDEVENIELELGKNYKEIHFIGCSGKLDGNKVTIDYIEPYGFAAFEVK